MRVVSLCVVCLAALLSACMHSRSIEGPMQLVDDLLACAARPATLIVMLPGAYDKPQDYIDQGFLAAVRERNIHADIQLVDAHLGYYTNQQIVDRLQDEVITPAKAKGYRQIWFVGISLGGYGTMLYSMTNPAALQGFFVMAPYMGTRDVPDEVQSRGGLNAWTSNVQNNVDIDLWRWLKGFANNTANLPLAYIGYGASDRFVKPNMLLADVLPKERSFAIPGGHDWATWQKLWTSFLDAAPLPRFEKRHAACVVR